MDDTNTTTDDVVTTMDDSFAEQTTIDDTSVSESDELNTLNTVESAIKLNIAKLDRLKEDSKPLKEMMKSFLENDENYMKARDAAQKASKLKSSVKRDLLQSQNGKELTSKIELIKEEIKEANEALSYYLREYQRITGSNEFEGEDGELRQIVYIAKLVRKTNLNR